MRRKRMLGIGRRTMAVVLAAVMAISGAGVAAPPVAEAAGTAADREDSSVVYFVDCGDYNVNTVSEGDQLGTHNSVTDQVYGADPVTGYKWGVDDAVSSPLENGDCPKGGVSTDWTWPYEFNEAGDGVPKTGSNRYTKNQFEKGIAERHLDYIAGGDTASGSVAVQDGELTVNLRATGDDNKAINVTYIIIKEAGDSSLAQTDLEAITVKATATGNITLPTEGKAGSKITWKSNNATVITDDGKVTRPEAGEEDATVILTATVTYGKAAKTKDFTVTVPAKSDMMGMKDFGIMDVTVTDPYCVILWIKKLITF